MAKPEDEPGDAPEDGPGEMETTMVRKGKAAFSLSEMGKFTKDLQTRPLPKLLADLPGLLKMPDSKYPLVAMALGKRMRASNEERTYIQMHLEDIRARANALVRERCDAILKAAE
jgi:hypothetical protein